jgi:hypothetical protein
MDLNMYQRNGITQKTIPHLTEGDCKHLLWLVFRNKEKWGEKSRIK